MTKEPKPKEQEPDLLEAVITVSIALTFARPADGKWEKAALAALEKVIDNESLDVMVTNVIEPHVDSIVERKE
jgi:hypothetical protein